MRCALCVQWISCVSLLREITLNVKHKLTFTFLFQIIWTRQDGGQMEDVLLTDSVLQTVHNQHHPNIKIIIVKQEYSS